MRLYGTKWEKGGILGGIMQLTNTAVSLVSKGEGMQQVSERGLEGPSGDIRTRMLSKVPASGEAPCNFPTVC